MKFITAIVALSSAAVVYAQSANPFNIPSGGYQTSAGSDVNLTWTPTTTGTVSLLLRYGNSAFLNQSGIIASNLTNSGSYLWNVPSDIVRGSSYTVEIVDDADPSMVNYTPQFIIDSDVLTASSLVASATTTNAASSTVGGAAATSSGSGSMTASSSGSATTSGSSTGSASTTASKTSSVSTAGIQTVSGATGAAARATAMVGMLGAVALGALAL